MRIASAILMFSISMLASCTDASGPPNVPALPPPSLNPPASIGLDIDGKTIYVGWQAHLVARAFDVRSRPSHADGLLLSSSDPGVVSLSAPLVRIEAGQSGTRARTMTANVTTGSVGEAMIRATLNGLSDSIKVKVIPLPDISAGLAVDTFTVIELAAACGVPICYFTYAPIIRVVTGNAPVIIESVRIDYATTSTGWCYQGDMPLAANSSAHLNDMTQYFNGLLVYKDLGNRLPPGKVNVSILFRRNGDAGLLEAQGDIQRQMQNYAFPKSPYLNEWSCSP